MMNKTLDLIENWSDKINVDTKKVSTFLFYDINFDEWVNYLNKPKGEKSRIYSNVPKGNLYHSRAIEIIIIDTIRIYNQRKPYAWTCYVDIFK